MNDIIGIGAIVLLAILGAAMFFAPGALTKAEKRDDPSAVAQVKKTGAILIAGAVGSAFFVLKYSLR